ncbi:MAG: hypothetical protein V4719_10985 [Planctomycetota bacterium]
MARWICPTCKAAMTVKDSLVGQTKPCAKCGKPSEVFDVDAVPDADDFEGFNIPEDATPPKLPAKRETKFEDVSRAGGPVPVAVIDRIKRETPLLITIYRIGFAALAGLMTLVAGIAFINTGHILSLAPAFAGLGILAFVWIVTDFASDLFRCRRLLEEMAQR